MQKIAAIDTHTGGEPTRVVFAGCPDLGGGPMRERADRLQGRGDWFRQALIREPRGCDWIVGAALQTPTSTESTAGVIFFNNAGCLGMCGHGLIGVVEAMAYRALIAQGTHRFETPAGMVTATLHDNRDVSFENVESYRLHKDVEVQLAGDESITGDVAYGGNWFFLAAVESLAGASTDELSGRCRAIREALGAQHVCGANGAEIDHIELFAPPTNNNRAESRNFVLCPGGQYDRSPCGTGTSAKLACLAADGRLAPGARWRQESIVGSVFEATYALSPNGVAPTITGRAFVTGEVTFILDDDDPFRFGIAAGGR
ncbi:MAG: proline racemase family protein [Pirellulaceae bacterium]|jgi:4-hydroxyproline epimerase|nr:proline racemase family protein [Pirellulaceae bacterium]MDP7019755.1 proline racemase family protein [Pirellulaceae bacterium]